MIQTQAGRISRAKVSKVYAGRTNKARSVSRTQRYTLKDGEGVCERETEVASSHTLSHTG